MKIYATNPPQILSKQFDFVSTPFEKDIKIAFQYETRFYDYETSLLQVLNIPIIGGQRLDKIEQFIVLQQENIFTPTTYFYTPEYRPFKSIEEFDSFCELNEFVVKPISGARGIGVKIIDREQYKKLNENPEKNVNTIYSKEIEQQIKFSEDIDRDYVKHQFSDNQMIVQDIIKVNREFRLICFPNDSLIYERKKKPCQFLGNLSQGSTSVKIEEETITELDSTIINKVRNIMKRFKYPWLSVDLFMDEFNNVGVFEFQMEFAYEGFNPIDVRNKMEASIKSFIN
jgi:hypothetical protein